MRKNRYTIQWHHKAIKAFDSILDQKLKCHVLDAVENVIAPDPGIGKILSGHYKGMRSYRVGVIRIIYEFYKDHLLVVVLDIGHRKDIYRRYL